MGLFVANNGLLAVIHTSGDSTALDFVKAVCHVLALDPKLKESVEALKRMLLTQVNLGISQYRLVSFT